MNKKSLTGFFVQNGVIIGVMFIKFIRIFLLLLIFIGVGLIFTRQYWLADLTDYILKKSEITYINSTSNNIVVELPFPDAVVGKEFGVIGKARGTWYFEASFPIEVLDKNGKSLAISIAEAQSDWMTENFVPFKADIKIPLTYIGPATLILKKDNPSGLPQNEASISFPINIEY